MRLSITSLCSVEIDLGDSGLEYAPGDALGIWPANCPEVRPRSTWLGLWSPVMLLMLDAVRALNA